MLRIHLTVQTNRQTNLPQPDCQPHSTTYLLVRQIPFLLCQHHPLHDDEVSFESYRIDPKTSACQKTPHYIAPLPSKLPVSHSYHFQKNFVSSKKIHGMLQKKQSGCKNCFERNSILKSKRTVQSKYCFLFF